MQIIIDGYNLLKSTISTNYVTSEQIQAFIKLISRYATLKNHQVTLVFDGGPYERPTKYVERAIEVIYAGKKVSADAVIMALIETLKKHDSLIVSSDRAIVCCAQEHAIPSIDADAFCTILKKEQTPVHKQYKDTVVVKMDEASDIDELMYNACNTMINKDICNEIEVGNKGKKASKTEKKLINILKKL